MKKIVFSFLSLFLTPQLSAMPVLSPAEPALVTEGVILSCCDGIVGIKFGYRGDFVYTRKVKSFFKNSYKEFNRNFRMIANEGVLTVNIAQMVDLYTFLGSANFSIEGRKSIIHDRGTSIDFSLQSEDQFIGGMGLKAILWEGNIAAGGRSYVAFDCAYENMLTSNFKYVTLGNDFFSHPGIGYSYHEYQAALTLGHKIKKILPYFSFIWSSARVNPGKDRDLGTDPTRVSFESLRSYKRVGYAIGASYYDDHKMSITVEARFVEEIACTIAGNIKF